MEPRVPKPALKYSHRKGFVLELPWGGNNSHEQPWKWGAEGFHQLRRNVPSPHRKDQLKRSFRMWWDEMAQQRGRRTAAHAAGGEQLRKELTDGFL